MLRAVAVTALAVALVLAILWLVSRDDHHYHDGQGANRPPQEQEEDALTRMNPLLALSRFVRMLRDRSRIMHNYVYIVLHYPPCPLQNDQEKVPG